MKNFTKKSCVLLVAILILLFVNIKSTNAYTTTNTNEKINNFIDVPTNAWYTEDLEWVINHNLMQGTGNNKFSPDGQVTRAMLVTVLWRLEGRPLPTTNISFSDVAKTDYYYNAIKWAAEKGVVNGVGNGKFAPNTAITREQVATILGRYLIQYLPAQQVKQGKFDDDDDIASYAKSEVYYLKANKIFEGTGNNLFSPKRELKRSELVSLLRRVSESRSKKLGTAWENYVFKTSKVLVKGNEGSILGFRKNDIGGYDICITNAQDIILFYSESANVRFFNESGKQVTVNQNLKYCVKTTGATAGPLREYYVKNNGDFYLVISPKGSSWLEPEITLIGTGVTKLVAYSGENRKAGKISFSNNGTLLSEYSWWVYNLFDVENLPKEGVLR